MDVASYFPAFWFINVMPSFIRRVRVGMLEGCLASRSDLKVVDGRFRGRNEMGGVMQRPAGENVFWFFF